MKSIFVRVIERVFPGTCRGLRESAQCFSFLPLLMIAGSGLLSYLQGRQQQKQFNQQYGKGAVPGSTIYPDGQQQQMTGGGGGGGGGRNPADVMSMLSQMYGAWPASAYSTDVPVPKLPGGAALIPDAQGEQQMSLEEMLARQVRGKK